MYEIKKRRHLVPYDIYREANERKERCDIILQSNVMFLLYSPRLIRQY